MTYLTDDERVMLLILIDSRLELGQTEGVQYRLLLSLRRKLEGIDKRVKVET